MNILVQYTKPSVVTRLHNDILGNLKWWFEIFRYTVADNKKREDEILSKVELG